MAELKLLYDLKSLIFLAVNIVKKGSARAPQSFPREQLRLSMERWHEPLRLLSTLSYKHAAVESVCQILLSLQLLVCQAGGESGKQGFVNLLELCVRLLDEPVVALASCNMQHVLCKEEVLRSGSCLTKITEPGLRHEYITKPHIASGSVDTLKDTHECHIGAVGTTVTTVLAPGPLPSMPISSASLRELLQVERGYVGHMQQHPTVKIAVAWTECVSVPDHFPKHLCDNTPVLLTGPYDNCVKATRPMRRSIIRDPEYAEEISRKCWIMWRMRSNIISAFASGSPEVGYYIVVMVFGKGIIPDGEEPFPPEVDGIPVEVEEGRWSV
jgi:hypothetical protein